MKKLIALLLVMVMALSFAACSQETKPTEAPAQTTTDPVAETKVMSYAEYMAAAIDDQVCIEAYVQATQSWWDNKITVYAQDFEGAYFLYEMACSEEDAAKLVPGTKIRVTGDKAEWSGEIEIMNATFEFVEGDDTYTASAVDVTELLGTDELIQKQNQKVLFTGMTIEKIAYKNDEPGDDIYLTVGYNGASYDFCIERYLIAPETELYKAVAFLKEGDVVDIEGFLYWYEGVNTHVTGISKEGLPIVDMTPYLSYLGTWYANGSSAAHRLVLADDRTWQYQTPAGEVLLSGNFLISDDGLQLFDPEGVLAIVMTLESQKEVYLEVYMDTLLESMSTFNFFNEVTNSEPEHSAIVGDNTDVVVEPTEEVPEETLVPEEDPTEEADA